MPQPRLSPQSLIPKVQTVLKDAAKRNKGKNMFMTSYQILALLPEASRKRLIRDYGLGGKGSGHVPAATTVVSEAAQMVPDIEIMYFDTRFAFFEVPDGVKRDRVEPSAIYCGLFRLPDGSQDGRICKLPPGTAASTFRRRTSVNRSSRQQDAN